MYFLHIMSENYEIVWFSRTFCKEILKIPVLFQFLQDILDTLFVILDDNTEKYGLLVFQSLVRTKYF